MDDSKERMDPWIEDVEGIQSYIHLQRYEYAMRKAKDVVLDVGCGLGYGSAALFNAKKSVSAFDISEYALLYAVRYYPGPAYLRADVHALPFRDGSFESVVAFEVIEHVDNGIQLLREIYRVLKNRGKLFLSTPNIAHLRNRLMHLLFRKDVFTDKPKNPYHKYEYTNDELTRLLKTAGFIIEKKWGQILTFPLVHKLPPYLYANTGHFLPNLSLYIIYEARKEISKT